MRTIGHDGWHLARAGTGDAAEGPQGQLLTTTISQEICGASQLGAGLVHMPPGHHSRAHLHRDAELVVHVVEGNAATLVGERLDRVVFHDPGDTLFIAPGVPHAAVNLSRSCPVRAIEVRGDQSFNADVVPLPELDDIVRGTAIRLQDEFAAERQSSDR
ncbi:cupin domain-containing protein [Actinoalloteichus spitiensis]|uniref:cupin domain-containing protein n=1 Tax=Actinoalloteichus spitiensis TaxID=252394 RepID=UPI000365D9CC|nr:cupin domain-containing protein [Actinoalloteichus spitiensis]